MVNCIEIDGKKIDFSNKVVMGILNVTPDSFFDGGCYSSEVALRNRIDQILGEGADIIDLGAYSTRPGAPDVSVDEELKRLDVAMELIRRYHPDAIVSIDTFRSSVASAINRCFGPVIVNDISGGTMDPDMFDFVAESGLPYIMMHIQGTPETMQDNPEYDDVTLQVKAFFQQRVSMLAERGFSNLILDPGFGFGKRIEHNYKLLNEMDSLIDLGFPILVGVSRKSMIYKVIGGAPADALNGTTVLNTIALLRGASILRVHDVRQAVETVRLVKELVIRN
ncbi:MAG: dihydropteroate synthase [Marinifilaceae bacterium]|nr:dihydropteroate synthase [Marinifilaceae bacterium]